VSLHTPDDLAVRFALSRRQVLAFAAAGKWPHERFGRRIRFTDEHVSKIQAMHEVAPKAVPEDPWGRRGRGKKAS
jgi:hypothetical protein